MVSTQCFQSLLVKHSSAALSVLVMTLITPASALCFTLPLLMGSHSERMQNTQFLALAVLLVGVASPAPPIPPRRYA